jgi:vacuolar-type H+-ATPase subunit H
MGLKYISERKRNLVGKVAVAMQKLVNGTSIRYIVDLDKKARERVNEARREAESIENEAESKKNKMRIDYDEQARERLGKMESSYRFEAEKKISKIEADKNKKTQAFDKALSQNREKLLDEVFEAVTGTKRRN